MSSYSSLKHGSNEWDNNEFTLQYDCVAKFPWSIENLIIGQAYYGAIRDNDFEEDKMFIIILIA